MSWKKLLESVSEALNDHIRLRNEYLIAENRILRNQIDSRVQLTDSECQELAELGAKLGKKALEDIATVATPDTILAWHRKFADQKVDTSQPRKSVGRPRTDQEIEDLVVRMACENRSWGYDRIQGALKHLGSTISDQTVGNILKRHGIPPAPERKKTVTWGEFVRSHWDVLLATDFFNSEVWSWLGRMISFLLFFLHVCRRQVHVVGVVLPHPMQGMRSFVSWSRNVTLHAHPGRYRVTKRLPARPYGDAIPESAVVERVFCDEGRRLSQEQGTVLFLLAVYPRPIRDGPIRRGQRVNELVQPSYRKAA